MNVEVRFRGRRDVPLDEMGRAEADAAARNLAHVPLSAVYTSPLGRAREVAQTIAAYHNLPEARDLPGLVNVDYGRWEGLTKEECRERDPEAFRLYAEEPERAACPGGEALATAADRVLEALREIGRVRPGESVAAVTHGAMVRLAVLWVAGPCNGSDWQFKLPTGSATIFEVRAEQVSLVSAPDRHTPDPRKAASYVVSDSPGQVRAHG